MKYYSPRIFLKKSKQIEVLCRDFQRTLGELKLWDKHFNLILVTKEGEEVMIRGDFIIGISRL